MSKTDDLIKLGQFVVVAVALKRLYVKMEDMYFANNSKEMNFIDKEFDTLRQKVYKIQTNRDSWGYYSMYVPWLFSAFALTKICWRCGSPLLLVGRSSTLTFNCTECGEGDNFQAEEIYKTDNFSFESFTNRFATMENSFLFKIIDETVSKAVIEIDKYKIHLEKQPPIKKVEPVLTPNTMAYSFATASYSPSQTNYVSINVDELFMNPPSLTLPTQRQ